MTLRERDYIWYSPSINLTDLLNKKCKNALVTSVTCHCLVEVTSWWLVSLLMIQPLVQSLAIQFVLSRRAPFIHGSLVFAQSQKWVRRSVICRRSALFSPKTLRSSARHNITWSLSSNTPCRECPLFLSSRDIVNKHHLRHIPFSWRNFRLIFIPYISSIYFVMSVSKILKMSAL